MTKIMNNTKGKILKKKIKDELQGIMMLFRGAKLGFLPKFCLVDVQVNQDELANVYFCYRF